MSKKHHKNSRRPSELSSDQLERQARDDMTAGRFRKARDTYKILCKQDREKHLPALIEANRCLAEQLVEKGQIPEAEQVLAHLKTIAPSSSVLATDVSVALKKNDWLTALDAALCLWKDLPAVPLERDRAAVADALVLAFPNLQETETLARPEATDLEAVVGALRCLTEQRWEKAQELLRPLPRGSLFAAWKILVKGMIAFYTGDPEKAQALFAQLPPHGVPVRAANAFQLFLGPSPSRTPDEPARDQAARGACCLLNATNLAPFLLRANQSWRAARYTHSYEEMRRAPGFPSEESDLAGALSDFYFKAAFAMSEAPSDEYVEWFKQFADSGRFNNDAEARLTYRLLGCAELKNPYYDGDIEFFWRSFLGFFPADDPQNGKVTSLVLEQVGAHCALREEDEDNPFFPDDADRFPPALRDAIRVLEESIERDPSNLGAYFKLLDVYESAEKDDDRDLLLDRMADLFPRDKSVLLRAAKESLQREAYVKGIQYLERAHSLDALDPVVLQELAGAYTALAKDQYKKKNINKGRHTFDLARRHGNQDKLNFYRGLDFLQATQGVLELTFGDKGMGQRLMTAARKSTSSIVALLFFAHGISRLNRRKRGSPFWAELLQNRALVASASARKEVYLVFEYLHSIDEDLGWSAESEFVAECLLPVSSEAFSREEAADLVPLLAEYPQFIFLAERITREALRRNPTDPRFRLYSLFGCTSSPTDLDTAALAGIYHDAIREGDTKTATLAQGAMRLAEDFGDPSDEQDDFGFSDKEIEEMRRMASTLSDAEFEAFRQKSGEIIPLPIFDLVMAGIRGKSSPRPQPERQRRGTWKTDELDLFNQ